MSKTSDKDSQMTAAGANDHGWLRPQRIPASEYTSKFLSDLQARQQVLAVDEGWSSEKARPPAGIRWVLYPNGDLLNVGVD